MQYIGNNPPQNIAYLPDVSVKDNVIADFITDGTTVDYRIDIPNGDLEAIGTVDVEIMSNIQSGGTPECCLVMGQNQIVGNYYTLRNNFTKAGLTLSDMQLYAIFSASNGTNNSLLTYGSLSYKDNLFSWQSTSTFYSVSAGSQTRIEQAGFEVNGGWGVVSFLVFKHVTGATLPAGIRVRVTARELQSKQVVYVNGQSIQKNYLHNTGNFVNQSNYIFGTPVTTISQRMTDRWLANLNPSSISYSTPSDPELMTIVGGIYQGIEKNDLSGRVCVLHWEGTAQGSMHRVNGDVQDFKDSPIIFTMPTDVNTSGAMEYVTFSNGTLKHMKLELGEVPTQWEPEDRAIQTNICQRYLQIYNFPSFVPLIGSWRSGGGGTIMESPMEFRGVTMRANPAFSASTYASCDHVRTSDNINAGAAVPYLNYNDSKRFNFRSNIAGVNANFYNVVPTSGVINLVFDADIK